MSKNSEINAILRQHLGAAIALPSVNGDDAIKAVQAAYEAGAEAAKRTQAQIAAPAAITNVSVSVGKDTAHDLNVQLAALIGLVGSLQASAQDPALLQAIIKQSSTDEACKAARAALDRSLAVAPAPQNLEAVIDVLYHALNDASSVVDKGDDEDYAYQAELELGAKALGIERAKSAQQQQG